MNPNATDFREYWMPYHIHFADRWREVRHLVAIGPRNGRPIHFPSDMGGVVA